MLDAERFDVVEVDKDRRKVVGIEEKPGCSRLNYAVTAMYIYHKDVFTIIEKLKPSGRGEIEITDINNCYIQNGNIKYSIQEGYWSDSGTFDSFY